MNVCVCVHGGVNVHAWCVCVCLCVLSAETTADNSLPVTWHHMTLTTIHSFLFRTRVGLVVLGVCHARNSAYYSKISCVP